MRFNKNELITIAKQPSQKFDKEGLLFITERQEGFFRKTEGEFSVISSNGCYKLPSRRNSFNCIGGTSKVSLERWCRLRGNLLFYLKSNDQFSEPQGVIVLEKCTPVIQNERKEHDGFVFYIAFQDGLKQRLAAHTIESRTSWISAIKSSSYTEMRRQLQKLREQIEKKRTPAQDVDVDTMRIQSGREIDINSTPICESALSCDNLLCDAHGRSPNPSISVEVTTKNGHDWIKYGQTEVLERTSNPNFSCTIQFRSNDGLTDESQIRFNVLDVREKVSQTAVPLGIALIQLNELQEETRLRIPVKAANGNTVGFITITNWLPENNRKINRSPAKKVEHQTLGHRRSQSLPPKLGVKLFVPAHEKLSLIYTNPCLKTYRFHSGLGGDISVQELMMECRLSFLIPQQLLSIWIMREKELLQEISGMGELGGEWRNKQMDLLDKHLKLLKDYSQAKQTLQQYSSNKKCLKPSSNKGDENLEFVPVNLHLQRMCAHNDTLKRTGTYDVITVGAFTRHSGKSKTGGLIKLLQQVKESPSRMDQKFCRVQAANDAVQAIKQLRKEVVEIMSQLLFLAKSKNSLGMMPLCNEMITKTRSLLNMWEPSLVEEVFAFIETHRIIDQPDNIANSTPISPFKKITQQLGALDLKSPDLEDFATPMGPAPDLWPQIRELKNYQSGKNDMKQKSPSATDLNTLTSIQNSVKSFNSAIQEANKDANNIRFSETHFDVNGDISSTQEAENAKQMNKQDSVEEILDTYKQLETNKSEILGNGDEYDENGMPVQNCSIILGHHGTFLDTKTMTSCPSANYYRPTEEPEPLDLTQLNIEASVMCLVSKVKFLCGRCGSPAVRLRTPKAPTQRGFNSLPPDIVTNQPSLTPSIDETHISLEPTTETKQENITNPVNLNLALSEAVGEVARKVKKGNKFTDGLDLSMTNDWASELRPSMRKLRHAMDGLLKTARLMHSVERLQQDMKRTGFTLSTMYRRDVCFSQALTSLIAGLMARFWGNSVTPSYLKVVTGVGPIAFFEGLLSLYGAETDMWSDMCIAIEDLGAVTFTITRCVQKESKNFPLPRILGSRQSLNVLLPVPDSVYCNLPSKDKNTFKVIPVFFNIGINEKATLAETLGYTKEQNRSNWDNFDRLKQYVIRYKKTTLNLTDNRRRGSTNGPTCTDYLASMEELLRQNCSKCVRLLHLAEDLCRLIEGIRFTSCKSAKDRTGMSVTLENCRVLTKEFHLPSGSMQNVLDVMRREGTRLENTRKNVGVRKYAFSLPQTLALPQQYRPPSGSYGNTQT